MRGRKLLVICSALTLLVAVTTTAQVTLSTVTGRVGVVRTLRPGGENVGHLWSFYPELEVGGGLFAPYLDWGLSWGYWSDGVDQRITGWVDMITYGESGHIFVLRMGFEPQKAASHWPLPLKIFAGVSEQIISHRYLGGTDYTGRAGTDRTSSSTTLYGGLGLVFPLSAKVQLEARTAQFFPIGVGTDNDVQENRRSYTLGVAFIL